MSEAVDKNLGILFLSHGTALFTTLRHLRIAEASQNIPTVGIDPNSSLNEEEVH